jgi:penicillin-binding protein 1A
MRVIFKAFFELALTVLLIAIFCGFFLNEILPDIELAESIKRNFYVKLYDRKYRFIRKYGHWQEGNVDVRNLPKHVVYALLDCEDKNFFEHYGFDILAIIRSFILNIINRRIVAGGSSLTQQLAKSVLQYEEKFSIIDKTIWRKIQELMLAIKIERRYKKHEILTMYFNRVYFGGGCYGITAAAAYFFNKSPYALNLYETVALIVLLKAPSRIAKSTIEWRKRIERILKLMLKNGHITKKDYDGFKDFKLPEKFLCPQTAYFGDYVMSQIPFALRNRDLEVITTLDLDIHDKMKAAIDKVYGEWGAMWTADQCAGVVKDKVGGILAMIGGLDYAKSQFNCAAQANRSLGSFFKYYVYLYAMEHGLDPEAMIDSKPLVMGAYAPSNYLHEGTEKMSVQDAFAGSINSSAIMLFMACGMKNIANFVSKKLGLCKPGLNPGIVIGGMNASVLQIATSLIPIINRGYSASNHCILEIRDAATQEILYKHSNKFKKVLTENGAYYMWQVMCYAMKYGTSHIIGRLKNKIVGGKSGTSNDYRDLVFAGATPDYVFAFWYGRNDCKPMTLAKGKQLSTWTAYHFLDSMPATKRDIDVLPVRANKMTFEQFLIKVDADNDMDFIDQDVTRLDEDSKVLIDSLLKKTAKPSV